MFRFSKKIDYGLILLSDMCNDPAPASAREMAARYKLPQPMIANILKALSSGGVLQSTRGAQGGYELARNPRQITLAQIVEAVEGPFSLVDCVEDDDQCRYTEVCPTHDPLQVVHRKFQSFMEGLTLAEIVGSPQPFFQFRMDGNENALVHG